MKIVILGSHTEPCGDFPYDKGNRFLRSLRERWTAIRHFSFTSIDSAEISINPDKVSHMTVKQVYDKLETAVKEAADAIDWDIWFVPSLEKQ